MTIRVLVADDQRDYREGLIALLSATDTITVVGQARDGQQAIEACQRHHPDVILMDIRMPVLDGIDATRTLLTSPSTSRPVGQPRVIMLTTFDLDQHVYDALRAGASGYLLKDVSRSDLIEAIHTVHDGDAVLAPRVTSQLVQTFATRSEDTWRNHPDTLTDRETEVLLLLAAGRSNAEIADALFVSTETVKSHVSSILRTLQVRDRTQAAIYAWEHGYVHQA